MDEVRTTVNELQNTPDAQIETEKIRVVATDGTTETISIGT